MSRRSRGAAVVLAILTLAGCSAGDSTGRTLDLSPSGSGSPEATTGSVTEWIAVLRTEADPNDLDADTSEVMAIVGGAIVVSPVACFEGLPADFAPDAYVLGVVAPTRDELDLLLTELQRTAIFEGRVRTMCLD